MATTAGKSGAGKKRSVKKKVVKKKAVKKKAVARKKLDEVVAPYAVKAVEELAKPSIPSVSTVQDTITVQTTRSVRSKDITVFLRQLIMMLEAGTPILKALKSLSHRGEHKGIRNLVYGIAQFVEAGNPLWQAFAREGKHFSPIYVNLMKAAEASGTLTTVLRRLVIYREKREIMRRKIIVAMIYPAAIAFVAYIIIWLLATFLIPEFEAMFATFDITLEGLTAFVLSAAAFVGGKGSIITVLVVIGGSWAFYTQFWVRSPLRRVMTDRMKFKLPISGPITTSSVVAEFTRTFAMLQRSGVLMISTLELCRNSSTNRAFAGSVQDMRDSVERGDGLEGSLRAAEKSGYLPGVVVDMLITGEETGTMDTIADQIADSYEQELELQVEGLKEALGPIMVIGIGLTVGAIVIALFLPLVQLITEVSSAGM